MQQVKEFLQEHEAGLEHVTKRLLETTIVQGPELKRLLQEAKQLVIMCSLYPYSDSWFSAWSTAHSSM
jgi:hypothetical protein